MEVSRGQKFRDKESWPHLQSAKLHTRKTHARYSIVLMLMNIPMCDVGPQKPRNYCVATTFLLDMGLSPRPSFSRACAGRSGIETSTSACVDLVYVHSLVPNV